MENLTEGSINKEVMSSKKVSTQDKVGKLGKKKRKSESERRKGKVKFADSPCWHWCATGGDKLGYQRQ